MPKPSLCVVFNNVDDRSSIGKLCAWSARTALEAGWDVSLVARDVAEDLRSEVDWLPMYVPPRLHAVQWYSAYPAVRKAVGGRTWDVVHVQQPQLSGIADILHLHYLVRAAREANARPQTPNLRQRFGRVQARLTEVGESRQLAHLPKDLELVPVSKLLQAEFERLYGWRPRTTVLENPAPEDGGPSPASVRTSRRADLSVLADAFVIGFLGGDDPRKGGWELLDAVSRLDNVVVLYGGSGIARHPLAADTRRVVPRGFVENLTEFFDACDAFAAVSSFDPAPLAPLEALKHGVPVIGTTGCGGVAEMVAAGAALQWSAESALQPLIDVLRRERVAFATNARQFAERRSARVQSGRLLEIYDRVAASRVAADVRVHDK